MPKIIQTFWVSKAHEDALLNSGGFLCPEIHYMSWAFSCLQLIKFYPNVELHTNKAGKEILINLLGLPYTKVHLSLETEFMDNLLPSMWAYCKIHTYSQQKEPFLHIDGDVFIWKPFETVLLQSPLIVQNIDENLQVYNDCLAILRKQAPFLPDWLKFSENQIKAYNAGIIGGKDIKFFKKYTDLAFEFYNKNLNLFVADNKENKHIHIIPEQYLLYVLSKSLTIDVSVQNDKIVNRSSNEFSHFVQIDKIPFDETYMHILGNFKKSKIHNDFVSFVLKQEYPKYWQKIMSFYEEKEILSSYMKRQIQMQNNTQKTVLPQIGAINEEYLNTKFFCKLFDINFETNKEAVNGNPKLQDLYIFETKTIEFSLKELKKHDIKEPSFPTYNRNRDVFEQQDYEDYYIVANPYHEIITTKFGWSEHLGATSKEVIDDMNPLRSTILLYLDMYYFSNNLVWINDSLLHLFEKIKLKPTKIGEFLNSEKLQLQDNEENNILSLLKKWYAYGIIYLSKSGFIPQEPSKIYIEHQLNLKKQIASCLNYIVNFHKIEDYNPLFISQFNENQKITSLQEIINVLEKLNFEAKGVRGNMNNLGAITPPAIAQLKLRNYLKLYVIITKVTDTYITIYNTELMEDETYSKKYFSTIWDGILILISPRISNPKLQLM
ncbi:DUF6734 family protein [Flavobacterium gawalongense]|uniref:Peptidase C39 domain-containing protein n=1 Tax=Flavobacterium gawalongense TaxID=2594432 RepID=A0A553BN70_9FLAO|nr:DUF6734 family protein [Flavobacterium gawalongense]TRX00158.1 hypothetical protein FNW33_13195 [Flavobacterium gawalongense]TRX04906.1 hypothetical protein FNW12_12670 [Flavobacterium gawalongense]TRX09684.1 hypothetical protein FNW11_09275 [Flavobacterium gawalongense]TRX10832.1 hypothetical protein FNW10_08745 [Flavobacterium gawalongense]TRX28089.1 hypothetical protein FNW38_08745 [Flavobacterium gawalongense]